MSSGVPYVMNPLEVLCGMVIGPDTALPPPRDRSISPLTALEDVVLQALLRAPCGVAFSGGRDSSVVLAVAAHVARRDGLPAPIPITLVFGGAAEAEEDRWQELVIRHLGLQDWARVPIQDELDLVGPLAQRHLRAHGIVWPSTIARDVPMLDLVRGGSLIDGEGGDEVFGDTFHRIAPLAYFMRHPRPPRRRLVKAALAAVGPARLRIRRAERFWNTDSATWLRPPGRAALMDALADLERAHPLSFAASVRRVPVQRHHVLAARNRTVLAGAWDVDVTSPLVDTEVVHALARQGGALGPGDRTAALRAIVPGLLPDELLTRTSKANFTDCFLGPLTRRFAADWDGTGVDPNYVDSEALRAQWLGDEQHALTAPLLQQAWLATAPATTQRDFHEEL